MNAAAPGMAMTMPGWRSRALLVLLLAGFVVLLARAVYLQGLNSGFLQKKGDARYGRVIKLSATRGMITDRNGEVLAISTPVESVKAIPADVEIVPAQAKRLSQLLEVEVGEISKRLPLLLHLQLKHSNRRVQQHIQANVLVPQARPNNQVVQRKATYQTERFEFGVIRSKPPIVHTLNTTLFEVMRQVVAPKASIKVNHIEPGKQTHHSTRFLVQWLVVGTA